MRIKSKKSKKSNILNKYGIMYFTVIIFLSVIGIGYGIWNNGIAVTTTISTGSIDAVFSYCYVTDETSAGDSQIFSHANAEISNNGKTLNISVEDAVPGYCATVTYTIENRSSIPVMCTVEGEVQGPVEVGIEQPLDIIDVSTNNKQGNIYISINDVEQKTDYRVAIDLKFVQYNMSLR